MFPNFARINGRDEGIRTGYEHALTFSVPENRTGGTGVRKAQAHRPGIPRGYRGREKAN